MVNLAKLKFFEVPICVMLEMVIDIEDKIDDFGASLKKKLGSAGKSART